MKNKLTKLSLLFLIVAFCAIAYAAIEVRWDEADKYYGQTVTVTGKIVGAHNSGKACFLNFHQNWKKYFTAVIFASDFSKFPTNPEEYYLNKEVKITGFVKEYQGKPEIILKDPTQIQIVGVKQEVEAKVTKEPVAVKSMTTQDIEILEKVQAQELRIKALEEKVEKLQVDMQRLSSKTDILLTNDTGAGATSKHSSSSLAEGIVTKLSIGMSKNDIIKLYGKPTNTSSYTIGNSIYEIWYYSDYRTIRFENDKVNGWTGF